MSEDNEKEFSYKARKSIEGEANNAVSLIYQMAESVINTQLYLKELDANIKLLNNRITKLEKTLVAAMKETQLMNQDLVVVNRESKSGQIIPTNNESTKFVIGNIKMHGKITNQSLAPIKDALVKIYDTDGNVISTRLTDRDGTWEKRLPPGKYLVEYSAKGFGKTGFNIELTDGMREYLVK